MSDKIIGRNLDFGSTSAIKQALLNPYDDQAALDAISGSYGTAQEGILAYLKDTNVFKFWDGAAWQLLTNPPMSVEEIQVITGIAPPIDTDVRGTIVNGTPPTLTNSGIKILTWKDANDDWHTYSVENTSPLVITEISRNQLVVVTGSFKKDSDITGLPNRPNTVYVSNAGGVWISTEDSVVTRIKYNKIFSEVRWTSVNLSANTPQVFRLDGTGVGNTVDIGDDEIKTNPVGGPVVYGKAASSKEILVAGITILDSGNSDSVDTESFEVIPIDFVSFSVESNVSRTVKVIYTGFLTS